jgi:hypothetical protein
MTPSKSPPGRLPLSGSCLNPVSRWESPMSAPDEALTGTMISGTLTPNGIMSAGAPGPRSHGAMSNCDAPVRSPQKHWLGSDPAVTISSDHNVLRSVPRFATAANAMTSWWRPLPRQGSIRSHQRPGAALRVVIVSTATIRCCRTVRANRPCLAAFALLGGLARRTEKEGRRSTQSNGGWEADRNGMKGGPGHGEGCPKKFCDQPPNAYGP